MDTPQLPKVKITSNGLWSETHVMIGDQELRVNSLRITNGRYNTLKLEIEIESPGIDIEVLERETELTIKKVTEPNQ